MTIPANASGYKDVYSKAYSVVNGEQVTTTTHGQSVQTTTYNALGKPASVTISAPDVPTQTQTFQYDALGRKIFSSYPGDTAGTATTYDALGRVIETNWPVSGPGKTGQYHTTTSYPSWDKVVHTNANGSEVNTTNYLVGSWNHSLGATETDIPTSAGEQKTTVELDAMGRMLSVTQGGFTRSYTYSTDGHFWLTDVHNPETGDTHYTYNDVGQVLSSQVGGSGITQNTYNVAGQLTTVAYPDKTTDTFTYTPTGKKATASISGNGQPNTWTYTYNALDHLKTATLQFGDSGPTFGFSYDYNDSGFLQSATYPDGTVINYAPNSLGKATKGGSWVNSVSYLADGHEKSFTDASGVTTTYTLNARHMVSGIDFSSLVNSITGDNDDTLSYQYDGDANVTSVSDSRPDHNRTYVYGDADWLTSGTVDGKAFSATYDITGNLLEKDDGGNKLAYHYDKQNRLQSVSGPISGALTGNNGDKQLSEVFTYDSYGDITSRDSNGTTFTYNDARQLVQANGSNPATGSKFDLKYYYDAMGNRVAVQDVKASTLEYEIYNQKGKLLYKTDNTNATTYIYLNGRKIAESTHPSGVAATVGTSTFFHNDLQGSVVLRSDNNGNILNPDTYGQSYLPYGSELHFGINKDTLTKSIGEHIGFINKPFNSATGLSYFGARYYDPMIGRFMGTDPVGYVGGASSFNRYAYGNNNPMTYQDPDGNFSWHSFISGIGNDISSGFNDLMHINAGFTYGAEGYQPYMNGGGFSYGGSSDAVPSGPSPTEVAGAGIGIITFALGMPEDIPVAAGALLYESFGDAEITAAAAEETTEVGDDIVRVRHYTDKEGLYGSASRNGIIQDNAIDAGRGDPIGVHVEVSPFGDPETAGGELGAAMQDGANRYVEFDVSRSSLTPNYIGSSRNVATIATERPLSLEGRNATFGKVRPWWKLW